MKVFIICLSLLFSYNLLACPYGSIVKIDEKLQSSDSSKLTSETFSKISDLRSKGEKALKLGNIEESEKILNKALALFKAEQN